MKRTISVLIALLSAICSINAQEAGAKQDYQSFQNAVKSQSMLFRGRQATSYSNIRFNGNYYWHLPEYHEGSVMYNGKLYTGVMLNIDAMEHQLLTRYAPGMPEVIVARDYVQWFTIGDNLFVNLDLKGIAKAEKGYYMVYCDAPAATIYYRVEKLLKSSVDYQNGDGIGYEDPSYKDNLHTYFKHFGKYYILQGNKLKSISRRKAIKTKANASR